MGVESDRGLWLLHVNDLQVAAGAVGLAVRRKLLGIKGLEKGLKLRIFWAVGEELGSSFTEEEMELKAAEVEEAAAMASVTETCD